MRRQLVHMLVLSALLVPAQAQAAGADLQHADEGIQRAQRFWDRSRGWYDNRLHDRARYPLATVWSSVPLFEALAAVQQAAPSRAHRNALSKFAAGAGRYFDRRLGSHGGYAPYPGDRGGHETAWFDDNGWLGIAFYDAYRASGDHHQLAAAQRAFRFIAADGWDRRRGGLWWNTRRPYKAGEALASAALLGADLYGATGKRSYLVFTEQLIRWADRNMRDSHGLYWRSDADPTPMPYVQGPLALGFARLCRAGRSEWCGRATELADAAAARFGRLDMGPQYDWIYLRCMLELDRLGAGGGQDWRSFAAGYAQAALANSARGGLWLRAWDGSSMRQHGSRDDMLQTHAATSALFAWLAATRR